MGILGFLGGKKKVKSQRAGPSPFRSTSLQLSRRVPGRLRRQNNAASVCGVIAELRTANKPKRSPLDRSLASLLLILSRSPAELDANGNQPQGPSLLSGLPAAAPAPTATAGPGHCPPLPFRSPTALRYPICSMLASPTTRSSSWKAGPVFHFFLRLTTRQEITQ